MTREQEKWFEEGREAGRKEELNKLRKLAFSYVLPNEQIKTGIDYAEGMDRSEKTEGFVQVGLRIMEDGLYRMDVPKNQFGVEKQFTILVRETNRSKPEECCVNCWESLNDNYCCLPGCKCHKEKESLALHAPEVRDEGI